MLSDRDIAAELRRGRLRITGVRDEAIQPASVDLHLGDEFLVFATWGEVIDPRMPPEMAPAPLEDDGSFLLLAGEFALASTAEVVSIPAHISGQYHGKSSIGRLGIASHVTAGLIDAGFSGHITLELSNQAGRDVKLWPGMAIGQVTFTYLHSEAQRPYGAARGSHYQGQRGPTPSRAHQQLAERGLTSRH